MAFSMRPFGHAGGLDFLLQLLDFARFAAPQFLLDGLDLFVEVILFLGALHLALHARVDGAVHVELFDLDFQDVGHAVQPLDGLEDFQQFLLFLDRNLQIRGDGVGELAGVFHAHGGDHRVVVQALRKLDVLLEEGGDARWKPARAGRRLGLDGNQPHVARKKPSSLATCTILARSAPSTSTLMLPSGSFTLCTILASVPTW